MKGLTQYKLVVVFPDSNSIGVTLAVTSVRTTKLAQRADLAI